MLFREKVACDPNQPSTIMHHKFLLTIFPAIFFMGTTKVEVFSAETVGGLATRVEERLESIDAVEFTFRVRSNSFGAAEIKETRQKYAFFRSKAPDYPRSWERWEIFYEKNPGEWELDEFVAFDGKTVWTWNRIDPVDPGEFYKWSRGAIQTAITPDGYMGGNEVRASNEFPFFLFMGIVGYGKSGVDDLIRNLGLDKWQVVESKPPSEFILQRVIQAPNWDSGYFIRAHLRLEPVPVVWRTEDSKNFSDETLKNNFSEVESFGTFDGIYYPAKGRSISYAKNVSHNTIYEFEVESVKRLTETDKTEWIPTWPTGTLVRDLAFGKDVAIPHTKEQLMERQEEYLAKLGADREIKTQGRRNLFVLIVNVAGILLIFWLLYRRYKARQ